MRRQNFLWVALAIAILGLGGICRPASAQEIWLAYRLGGETCTEKFPGGVGVKNLKREHGKLINLSATQAIRISCPLTIPFPNASQPNSYHTLVWVGGYIKFRNSSAEERTFGCDLFRVGDDGKKIRVGFNRISIGGETLGEFFLNAPGVGLKPSYWETPADGEWGWPIMECTLLPQSEIISLQYSVTPIP